MTSQAKERLVQHFNKLLCVNDILEGMIEAIAEELQPEDVFDKSRLAVWAEDNDYVKET